MKSYILSGRFPGTSYYMIRWKPNVFVRPHGHNGKQCSFWLLKGALQEKIYKTIPNHGYYMDGQKVLLPGQNSYINDTIGLHSIRNLLDKPAWSLHRYYR